MIPIYYFLFNNLYFAGFSFDFPKFLATIFLIFAESHIFIRNILVCRRDGTNLPTVLPAKGRQISF